MYFFGLNFLVCILVNCSTVRYFKMTDLQVVLSDWNISCRIAYIAGWFSLPSTKKISSRCCHESLLETKWHRHKRLTRWTLHRWLSGSREPLRKSQLLHNMYRCTQDRWSVHCVVEEAQAARRGVESYKSSKSVPSIIARDCSSSREASLDWNAECHYVNRGRPVIRCIPENCFYAALLATYNYEYTGLKRQCGSY